MTTFNMFCLFLIGALYTVHAANCPGCVSEHDANDPEVKDVLLKTVAIQNSKSNDEGVNLLKITKVTSQVVAGTKYTFEFQVEGRKSKKVYNCSTVIVTQPWISPDPQVIEYNCSP